MEIENLPLKRKLEILEHKYEKLESKTKKKMREIKKYKKSAKYVELEVKHIQHKLDLIDNTALREKEPRNNQQPILEQTLFQSRIFNVHEERKGISSKPYYLQPIYSYALMDFAKSEENKEKLKNPKEQGRENESEILIYSPEYEEGKKKKKSSNSIMKSTPIKKKGQNISEDDYDLEEEKKLKKNKSLSRSSKKRGKIAKTEKFDISSKGDEYISLFQSVKQLIGHIKVQKEKACYFLRPVNPEELNIPDYSEFVPNPIDLGTISKRMFHNYYSTCTKLHRTFVQDVRRVFMNSIIYNHPDTPVCARAISLSNLFETELSKTKIRPPLPLNLGRSTRWNGYPLGWKRAMQEEILVFRGRRGEYRRKVEVDNHLKEFSQARAYARKPFKPIVISP